MEALHELRKQFESDLDQAFDGFYMCLKSGVEKERINELYDLTRFQIPQEVIRWVKEETGQYHHQLAQAITQRIEEEEQLHCTSCTQQRQFLEGVHTRLKYPPVVEETSLGPNNVFHQGFGAFGLIGGGIYVMLSYYPVSSNLYFWLRCLLSFSVGLYYGIKTYWKYEASYRKALLDEGDRYLNENKKRIREWFDQIISFCEDEQKFCIM